MEVSCLLEEGVAPTILQLLQAALCPKNSSTEVAKVGDFSRYILLFWE